VVALFYALSTSSSKKGIKFRFLKKHFTFFEVVYFVFDFIPYLTCSCKVFYWCFEKEVFHG